FSSDRFTRLANSGARTQKLLWASTSTKNPEYPDTLYVDNLIGPETVNTVPPATLEAFREHGTAKVTITQGVEQAQETIQQIEEMGISMDTVTRELEVEGVKAFADAFAQLLKTIDDRRASAAAALGSLADAVSRRISRLEADSVSARLWQHDPTLWTQDPEGQAEVRKRMGWMDSPEKARQRLDEYQSFARQVREEDLRRVLVLGMGGSSLTAEVLSSLQAAANVESPVSLAILDSTDPEQVSLAGGNFPPDKSLYLVASKSGGTAEVMAAFHYFWALSNGDGSRFAAITDPGTSLEAMAQQHGFRKIFSADETVGGRYSALTDFGLVPAALLGLDLARLLDRAEWMKRQCAESVPAARNPGLALGTVIGEAALAGRDKLTILADKALSAFAVWIEQIIAESSGKDGTGILPVPLEPVGKPEVYGNDRVFIYLRQSGELDESLTSLRGAGHPVIELAIPDLYEIGAEMYRWEVATAVACSILGVNAFDQPNVETSKKITKSKIAEYQKNGKLDEGNPAWVDKGGGLSVFSNAVITGSSLSEILKDFLAEAQPNGYVAINAYLPRDEDMIQLLQEMRVAIRARTGNAVTAGFGPRFQHSTGQFHKGGPENALFLVLTAEPAADFEVPTEGLSFGTLIRAQALGDYEALIEAGRKVLRVHLLQVQDMQQLLEALR
ncbi:MAG: bifunctional transaldolase/phosoglucose isomerase, partial [Chloroflexota bacterium]|nr:bifunctional transaldolase/phosoglucose isomerase [Chloroflexota bacterium]